MKLKFMNKYFSPSQQGRVYVVLAVVGVFVAAVAIMTILEPERSRPRAKPEVENIITDRNSREFGIEAINDKLVQQKRKMDDYEKEVEILNKKNESLENKVQDTKKLNNDVRNAQRTIAQLNDQLEKLRQEQATFKDKQLTYSNELDAVREQGSGEIKHPDLQVNPERRKVSSTSFSYGGRQEPSFGESSSYQGDRNVVVSPRHVAETDTRSEGLFTIVEDTTPDKDDSEPEIYLPRGSILTGVLITGLDAPTSAKAADEPIPVLVRIKKEAILPNFAVLDEVNECFALMAGYGDLSSERAMLRGESITCVKVNGEVIEADFRSFAVGEDGKNGLKGTLVTRNSKILANSMMAGFAAGLSSMFDVNPVPVLSTTSNGQTQYQDVFSTDALQGGAAKGASDAMNRLADYYMELADAMHPVIEVGAGRVVDMIVTNGTGL
ncbi:TrbI/VirB10 family protein [Vibrio sp. dhg]|uniref:TrbI/VirB10 family protein n=1 Tax=Vibrio sp. dhg TaxID=2163016 RepID=UPI000E4A5E49|nr:TrbI/VirB10 family protein [Vibrio sp. dhg]AXT74241.1 hypothetical protein DBX26_25045 [Vibrio sp. dhg]